jgi:outer membrane protein assembly factor BamB
MPLMYLGIKGHVVCLNRDNGEEVWRKKLKIDWGKPTIVTCAENLFVYVSGTLYCLAAETGEELWSNNLKGLGSGFCVMAIPGEKNAEQGQDTSQSGMSDVIDSVIDIVS